MVGFLAIAVAATVATGSQHVSVKAFGCDFAEANTVTVSAQDTVPASTAYNRRKIQVPATLSSDGFLEFGFSLSPGLYYISYGVDGMKCGSSDGGIVILPGHDRHIVVSMIPYQGIGMVTDWHARKFIAGILPDFGISISGTSSETDSCPDELSRNYPATIDDGAYYVDYAIGRHVFLRLQDSDHDILFIEVPDATPVRSNDEFVVRDITLDDVRLLANHNIDGWERCVSTPSGIVSPF